MIGSAVAEDEETGVQGPCVLQCATCRQVLGDTFAIVQHDPHLGAITLSSKGCDLSFLVGSVGSFLDDALLQTVLDRTAADFGCTFIPIQCKMCKEVVGRQYITTKPAFDALRGLYSLSVAKTILYELVLNENDCGAVEEPAVVEKSSGTAGGEDESLKEQVASLQIEIGKIQRFCLFLAQDLQQLSKARRPQ